MAEQNKATNPQHTTDVKDENTESANMDHGSVCDLFKQEDSDIPMNAKQQHSEDELNQQTSSASSNGDNGENVEQADVQISPTDSDSAEKRVASPTEGPSCPGEDNKQNVEKNRTTTQANSGSCGDNNGGTPSEEGDVRTAKKKAPEATAPLTLGDTKDDQVDGLKPMLHNELTGVSDTNTEAPEDDGKGLEKKGLNSEEEKDAQENTTFSQTPLPQEMELAEEQLAEQRNKNVENIGPTTQGTTEHSVPEVTGIRGGSGIYLIAAVCIVGFAMLVHLLQPESPPQKNLQQIDIFLRQMEKVKSEFPNQRPELWKRSRIHLERHLNTTHPTEPVSLILTAGLRAERTLHCLAQGLASTFSSALNASVLHIDGASKASQDSDQVKLDIDRQLQGAFDGDKPVAVIHRFEELPPGSTLIFYRYCDHENAAYKKTFLIFTVLLGEEEEIPAKIRLNTVEEMVDDHLQKKFLSHSHPVAFDRMDLDKYGGLWSRISHLILPVAAEKRIEHEGC